MASRLSRIFWNLKIGDAIFGKRAIAKRVKIEFISMVLETLRFSSILFDSKLWNLKHLRKARVLSGTVYERTKNKFNKKHFRTDLSVD